MRTNDRSQASNISDLSLAHTRNTTSPPCHTGSHKKAEFYMIMSGIGQGCVWHKAGVADTHLRLDLLCLHYATHVVEPWVPPKDIDDWATSYEKQERFMSRPQRRRPVEVLARNVWIS
ncbi:hypothetical protein PM082_008076 [Marasmius tenuissimus]|nr:hypothetical protein PM082_008076 [Marasmius tenuissimus]